MHQKPITYNLPHKRLDLIGLSMATSKNTHNYSQFKTLTFEGYFHRFDMLQMHDAIDIRRIHCQRDMRKCVLYILLARAPKPITHIPESPHISRNRFYFYRLWTNQTNLIHAFLAKQDFLRFRWLWMNDFCLEKVNSTLYIEIWFCIHTWYIRKMSIVLCWLI